jgi:hypothetical protein
LVNALSATDDPAVRKRLVRDTARELRRIAREFLGQRIEVAAEVLGLSDEDRRRAIEFNQVRNRLLGHFRSQAGGDELAAWLGDDGAYGLAARYLAAYVRWVQRGPPSAARAIDPAQRPGTEFA